MMGRLVIAAVLLVAACSGGCSPSAARPTASESVTPAVASNPDATAEPSSTAASKGATPMPEPFRLTSTAFDEGGAIPRRYSCDAEDVSPALDWEGAPAEAGALALIVDDPDANGFVHWIAFDLTASESGGLPEGVSSSPDAPPQGTNSFGRVGWSGPCPPSGTHHYRFRLVALSEMLGLSGAPNAADVLAAADGKVLDEVTLTGTYSRG